MKRIVIQSFFGIGDLLFMTPSLRVIKEAYPKCHITVNTKHVSLLSGNPFVDSIGCRYEGTKLMYTAPDTGRLPTEHHIIEDWKIICKAYNLTTKEPKLEPELYVKDFLPKTNLVGVQTLHKRLYLGKRVWPYYEALSKVRGFESIPQFNTERQLVQYIAGCSAVVCNEGGVSHIAKALGISAVVLFGGFTRPEWTGYSQHTNLVSDDIECSPCYNHKPCENEFKCWKQFSIEKVVQCIRKLL